MVWPVMKLLSSEARKISVPTMSSGTSARLSIRRRTFASFPSSGMFFSFSPLSVNPDAIAFIPDPELPELAGERAREAHHPALRGRVVDIVGHALEESPGGDVDDRAAALGLHRRKHRARAEKEAA